jgi:hypothetical protein
VFLAEEMVLGLPLERAAGGLRAVITSGRLGDVSDRAYGTGLTILTRVGPHGDLPGLAKSVRVQLLEPRVREGEVMYPVRWVATGLLGSLFPALDADLTLAPADPARTRLSIMACYRPPLGAAGTHLDRLLLHRAARATIRSFLAATAKAVTEQAAAAGEETPDRPRAELLPAILPETDLRPSKP